MGDDVLMKVRRKKMTSILPDHLEVIEEASEDDGYDYTSHEENDDVYELNSISTAATSAESSVCSTASGGNHIGTRTRTISLNSSLTSLSYSPENTPNSLYGQQQHGQQQQQQQHQKQRHLGNTSSDDSIMTATTVGTEYYSSSSNNNSNSSSTNGSTTKNTAGTGRNDYQYLRQQQQKQLQQQKPQYEQQNHNNHNNNNGMDRLLLSPSSSHSSASVLSQNSWTESNDNINKDNGIGPSTPAIISDDENDEYHSSIPKKAIATRSKSTNGTTDNHENSFAKVDPTALWHESGISVESNYNYDQGDDVDDENDHSYNDDVSRTSRNDDSLSSHNMNHYNDDDDNVDHDDDRNDDHDDEQSNNNHSKGTDQSSISHGEYEDKGNDETADQAIEGVDAVHDVNNGRCNISNEGNIHQEADMANINIESDAKVVQIDSSSPLRRKPSTKRIPNNYNEDYNSVEATNNLVGPIQDIVIDNNETVTRMALSSNQSNLASPGRSTTKSPRVATKSVTKSTSPIKTITCNITTTSNNAPLPPPISMLHSPTSPRQNSSKSAIDENNEEEIPWRMDPSESLSDWIVVVKDKTAGQIQTYHVHKNFIGLGQRKSEYFLDIFKKHNSDGSGINMTELELIHPAASVIPVALDYIYTGILPEEQLHTQSALGLRFLSQYLGIKLLYELVMKFIQHDLSLKTITTYYITSTQLGDQKIRTMTARHCARNILKLHPQNHSLVKIMDPFFFTMIIEFVLNIVPITGPTTLITTTGAVVVDETTNESNVTVDGTATARKKIHTTSVDMKKKTHISLMIAEYCRQHKDALSLDMFTSLTSDTYVPVLQGPVAVSLLETEVFLTTTTDDDDDGKQNRKPTIVWTPLQERCMDSLSKIWKHLCDTDPEQVISICNKLPPHLVTELLIRSVQYNAATVATTTTTTMHHELSNKNRGVALSQRQLSSTGSIKSSNTPINDTESVGGKSSSTSTSSHRTPPKSAGPTRQRQLQYVQNSDQSVCSDLTMQTTNDNRSIHSNGTHTSTRSMSKIEKQGLSMSRTGGGKKQQQQQQQQKPRRHSTNTTATTTTSSSGGKNVNTSGKGTSLHRIKIDNKDRAIDQRRRFSNASAPELSTSVSTRNNKKTSSRSPTPTKHHQVVATTTNTSSNSQSADHATPLTPTKTIMSSSTTTATATTKADDENELERLKQLVLAQTDHIKTLEREIQKFKRVPNQLPDGVKLIRSGLKQQQQQHGMNKYSKLFPPALVTIDGIQHSEPNDGFLYLVPSPPTPSQISSLSVRDDDGTINSTATNNANSKNHKKYPVFYYKHDF